MGADVQPDVVALGLDPVDFVDLDEVDAAGRLHHDALRVAPLAAEVVEQVDQPLLDRAFGRLIAGDRGAGPLERLLEPARGEGLQQVVEGVDVERLQRVLS